MISANVIKGVKELLEDEGIRLEPDETFGEMVARRLAISDAASETLLESLHDGATVEQAVAKAGMDPARAGDQTLLSLARAIGTALGRMRK
jgi:hypothetical protein